MQLPGQFNIYNALAAISVAGHFKVDRRADKKKQRWQNRSCREDVRT